MKQPYAGQTPHHMFTDSRRRLSVHLPSVLTFAALSALVLTPILGPLAVATFLLCGMLLIATSLDRNLRAFLSSWFILLIPSFCIASVLWSQFPPETLRYFAPTCHDIPDRHRHRRMRGASQPVAVHVRRIRGWCSRQHTFRARARRHRRMARHFWQQKRIRLARFGIYARRHRRRPGPIESAPAAACCSFGRARGWTVAHKRPVRRGSVATHTGGACWRARHLQPTTAVDFRSSSWDWSSSLAYSW